MLSHGDYATPEQGIPIEPPKGPWELCLTINDSWGFQHHDRHYKSVHQLIEYFAETIAMGGNLLLDVGPEEDGTIPPPQVQRLHALGGWIARHAEAVYPTVAGLPPGHFNGPTTLSADRRTLFLFVSGVRPESVAIRGLRSRVRQATVLSTGTGLPTDVTGGHGEVPGVTWVSAPVGVDVDPHMTVVASSWTASWTCTGAGVVSESRFDEWIAEHYRCCGRSSSSRPRSTRPSTTWLTSPAAVRSSSSASVRAGWPSRRSAGHPCARDRTVPGDGRSRVPTTIPVGVTVGDFATTRLPQQFTLVYLVRNTITNLTTQDEQVAAFANAAAHLEPGGCFVVENYIPSAAAPRRTCSRRRTSTSASRSTTWPTRSRCPTTTGSSTGSCAGSPRPTGTCGRPSST